MDWSDLTNNIYLDPKYQTPWTYRPFTSHQCIRQFNHLMFRPCKVLTLPSKNSNYENVYNDYLEYQLGCGFTVGPTLS